MIAVTKVDLFYDQLESILEYYVPNGSSPFANVMKEFLAAVGSDNFSWRVAPVCTTLQPFEWNLEALQPQLAEQARNEQFVAFLSRLEECCG